MLDWLKGKKSYITAALFGVFNFGASVGWWALDSETWVAVNTVLATLGWGFMRAGVSKGK
jgi:hypothetical protein